MKTTLNIYSVTITANEVITISGIVGINEQNAIISALNSRDIPGIKKLTVIKMNGLA